MIGLRRRILDTQTREEVREARACAECGAATRHGKPFCKAHVERMPYVRGLTARACTPR